MYSFSVCISLLCKYTQCGPYRGAQNYILIYASFRPILLHGDGNNQIWNSHLSALIGADRRQAAKWEKIVPQAAKTRAFWHTAAEKPPLILTGIRSVRSATNTPLTGVTPNRAEEKACKRKKKQLYLAGYMCNLFVAKLALNSAN